MSKKQPFDVYELKRGGKYLLRVSRTESIYPILEQVDYLLKNCNIEVLVVVAEPGGIEFLPPIEKDKEGK